MYVVVELTMCACGVSVDSKIPPVFPEARGLEVPGPESEA